MKPLTTFALKVGVVLAGYVAALIGAAAVVCVRVLMTQDPAAQASAGMYAFGDVLCFAGTLGVLSLPATGLGLYFLRPVHGLWTALAYGALALAVMGPIAAITLQSVQPQGLITALLFLSQGLGAPLLALTFLTCTGIAPTRQSRWFFLAATSLEGAVSVYVYGCLFVLGQWL